MALSVGVPRERIPGEKRVGLVPDDVRKLSERNIHVYIETNAGVAAGFCDAEYEVAGAMISYSLKDLYYNSTIIARVVLPVDEEIALIKPHHIIMAFFHFNGCGAALVEPLLNTKACFISYDTICSENGHYDVLAPTSSIAGRESFKACLKMLESDSGVVVTIIGAGNAGIAAMQMAVESKCVHIILLDTDIQKIKQINSTLPQGVGVAFASETNIERSLAISNVVLSCVYVGDGMRTPQIINRDMIKRGGFVIADVAADQGCSFDSMVLAQMGVKICNVENITSEVANEASLVLSSCVIGYLAEIATGGLEDALARNYSLNKGVNIKDGIKFHPRL